ncbi:MAG: hypothetical protein E5X86_25545 [Mesorhizobium sp.]|uniref:hypothetical protein n=1 Tax=Mesorhizobium sp. TaxID=1871066 RepID=UPI000FE85DB8|nr:hypothetical protein [Mesorhizobium sp.]RWI08675.1 MAG: hypothetical protein EOQ90_16445 [Mesorhizobium sp.]RWM85694.1 MAG: hypothetical protein EOR83_10520 [Mesorhizobium sp.]TIO14286.1 MAG: hypothetical protein E5X86_25545 [Mesorhizobium sp.]TIP95679.1 MAG: hypothetical protein E5X58_01935 [Mesorhizobium sp.]TIQ25161.1 MAG: hypothetical protein E5X61_23245 [Mesorhizobium sp.]
MDDNAKKSALLSVMQPAPAVLPKLNRPKLELSGADIRHVKEEGEKRDPVAGKSLREDKKEPTTIYVAAKDKRRLRLLAASEGRRVNDYYVEAVNDFLEKHANRLPKL